MSTVVSPASLSPSRRAWLRFKRNRLGYWSLVAFCALVLLSFTFVMNTLAELIRTRLRKKYASL